ncbi:hypothetical protein HBI70_098490 [Parastagonospora nodorum]|nr:hypothetical protein HBI06_018400 [Parastagonospora nodorum]KAH4243235.1 hypothetical protein HBI05_080760 [Parastagonospora nodorum]KAH4992813.1 hypothetical protein HBI76_037580 [Parastagonospora nodorum]KAH5232831.1 hypothetical protein HBI62_055810 [Parastagonospora nodorum]KAH5267852.1 hypothetical protein HBI71_071920 [Parastagonospora nodorum]
MANFRPRVTNEATQLLRIARFVFSPRHPPGLHSQGSARLNHLISTTWCSDALPAVPLAKAGHIRTQSRSELWSSQRLQSQRLFRKSLRCRSSNFFCKLLEPS